MHHAAFPAAKHCIAIGVIVIGFSSHGALAFPADVTRETAGADDANPGLPQAGTPPTPTDPLAALDVVSPLSPDEVGHDPVADDTIAEADADDGGLLGWRKDLLKGVLYFGALGAVGGGFTIVGLGLSSVARPAVGLINVLSLESQQPLVLAATVTAAGLAPASSLLFALTAGGKHRWFQALGIGLGYLTAAAVGGAAFSLYEFTHVGAPLWNPSDLNRGVLIYGLLLPAFAVFGASIPVVGAYGGEVVGNAIFPDAPFPSSTTAE